MPRNVTTIYRARTERIQSESRHRTNTQIIVLFSSVAFTLVVIGLGATISASSTVGINWDYGQYHFFVRQLLGVGLGMVVLLATSRVPYQLYQRYANVLFGGALVLLFLVLLVGVQVGGSSRWLRFGPVGFEPSELAKFAVVVLMASIVTRGKGVFSDLKSYSAALLLVVGSVGFLLLQQPDFGTTFLIAICACVVLWVGGAPLRYMLGTGVVALARRDIFGGDRSLSNGPLERIPRSLGRCLRHRLSAHPILGCSGHRRTVGRWPRKQPGQVVLSSPRSHRLHFRHHRGGDWVGGRIVRHHAVHCVWWCWAGRCARRAPDHFGQMLAAGITGWLGFQGLMNVGGVLGWLPITGITLPFISYGVSSLVVTMGALGVMFNVARQGRNPLRGASNDLRHRRRRNRRTCLSRSGGGRSAGFPRGGR